MMTTAIGTRLASCAAVAAVIGAIAAGHMRTPEAEPAGNLAALRTIHDATEAGRQVAYREVGGRIVIDTIETTDVRTAALVSDESVN